MNLVLRSYFQRFAEKFSNETEEPDMETYASILEFKNKALDDQLFGFLMSNILYVDIYSSILVLNQGLDRTYTHRQTTLSYYLLLIALTLYDKTSHNTSDQNNQEPTLDGIEGLETIEFEYSTKIPSFNNIKARFLEYMDNNQELGMPEIKGQYAFSAIKAGLKSTDSTLKLKKIATAETQWLSMLSRLQH